MFSPPKKQHRAASVAQQVSSDRQKWTVEGGFGIFYLCLVKSVVACLLIALGQVSAAHQRLYFKAQKL